MSDFMNEDVILNYGLNFSKSITMTSCNQANLAGSIDVSKTEGIDTIRPIVKYGGHKAPTFTLGGFLFKTNSTTIIQHKNTFKVANSIANFYDIIKESKYPVKITCKSSKGNTITSSTTKDYFIGYITSYILNQSLQYESPETGDICSYTFTFNLSGE